MKIGEPRQIETKEIGRGNNKIIEEATNLAIVFVKINKERNKSFIESEFVEKYISEYKLKFDELKNLYPNIPSIASFRNLEMNLLYDTAANKNTILTGFSLPNLRDVNLETMSIDPKKTNNSKLKNIIVSHSGDSLELFRNKIKKLTNEQKNKILEEAEKQMKELSKKCTKAGVILSKDCINPFDDIFFTIIDCNDNDVKVKILIGDLDHVLFTKKGGNFESDKIDWNVEAYKDGIYTNQNLSEDLIEEINKKSSQTYYLTLEDLLN